MSTLRTVDDLRADALFRSGEPPTDTTGSFWVKSLEYMNRIQQTLLLGGSVSAGRDLATSAGIYAHLVDIPITDWWWARRLTAFVTVARQQVTTTTTLTSGVSTSFNVASPITSPDIRNWYVVVRTQPTVYRVQSLTGSGSTVNLDTAYADDTLASGTQLDLAQLDYDLAADFIRFASPPYVHSVFGAAIDVSSIDQRNINWPLSIASIRQGRPTRAFRVGTSKIAVNAYDTRAYRAEYEYIAMPNDLVQGGDCILPTHHRQVLSSGAAMLIAFDKGDSRAANLASEFRELVGRMVQEHRRALGGGSSTFCQFRTRSYPVARRSLQAFGELFLV